MKVLSKKTLDLIKESLDCRNRLAYELRKSEPAVRRYVYDNNPILTSASALIAIREELNIPDDEPILEDQK